MNNTKIPDDLYHSFLAANSQLQTLVHQNAVQHLWWEDIPKYHTFPSETQRKRLEYALIAEKLALIMREVSEALEALRDDNPPDKHLPEYNSLTIELADTIIRILDLAGHLSLPLSSAILDKHNFNTSRPPKHGKRF